MRLIRSNNASRESESLTPASLFEAKYDWLMRWAMHFAQNDRAAAEDLVQDAFVRLMNSWPRIKDSILESEPVLYSYLRYAYLTEIRRGRRFKIEQLALIEFDDVRLSLKEERTSDPIEVQDDLRRIVAYLCWRKRSAKSASILLLRFFHGYFVEEITRIAVSRRGVVDELLRTAREEVKAYLADPSRVEIMRLGKPPEVMPRQVAVPEERFAEELRHTIFEARTGLCLDRNLWMRHYGVSEPKPVPCELLAHIVSCERCLEAVHSGNGLPPLAQRSQDGIFGVKRRAHRASGPIAPATKEEIRRSIAGGMERFRQLYEHHPRGLMVVVNGDVLAMRDVNSATSELKVQVGSEKTLDIVEVVSEQNIPLLTLYVASVPLEASPEQCQEVALSDDRKLELRLRYTGEGAVIEVHYNDPTFLLAAGGATAMDSGPEDAEAFTDSTVAVDVRPRRRSWWRRFLDRATSMELPEMNPMLATAMLCAMAAVVFLILSLRTSSVMKADELLRRAATSENALAQSGANGVVVQGVRIQTPRLKVERTLYRDVQGKRRLKDRKLSQEDASLRAELEALGISWNDPLSADSFRDWYDHASVLRDVVRRPEKGLLTLIATMAEGSIAKESLTVREADFHPVERTVELRNAGTVEIAELNYSVLPWSSVNPDLFEAVSDVGPVSGKNLHASVLPHLPRLLSPVEIDEAELGARLVLNRLHLDANDRLEVVRQPGGVRVQGVVENSEEKHQLQAQLYMVSNVSASIQTIQEMAARPAAASDVTSIRQSSAAAVPELSALEQYFAQRGMDRTAAGVSVQEFVLSSFTVKRQSEQIAELMNRFSSSVTLSDEARTELSELLIQHKAALLDALGREDRQLTALQLIPHSVTAARENLPGNAEMLHGIAEHNVALCAELISEGNPSPRSAQEIAPQLADSIAQLRAVVLQISAAAQLYTPSSGSPATTNQNK